MEEVLFSIEQGDVCPALRKFGEFIALIHKTTQPRKERLPIFSDAALQGLTMPVLAFVGAKDALLDSGDTRSRIERLLDNGEVRYLADVGHFISGQGAGIAEFLERDAFETPSSARRSG
jgi:pimeloyl-ACP methyl ester carboxylesterase